MRTSILRALAIAVVLIAAPAIARADGPDAKAFDEPIVTHTTTRGESCADIAKKVYGSPKSWALVLRYNRVPPCAKGASFGGPASSSRFRHPQPTFRPARLKMLRGGIDVSPASGPSDGRRRGRSSERRVFTLDDAASGVITFTDGTRLDVHEEHERRGLEGLAEAPSGAMLELGRGEIALARSLHRGAEDARVPVSYFDSRAAAESKPRRKRSRSTATRAWNDRQRPRRERGRRERRQADDDPFGVERTFRRRRSAARAACLAGRATVVGCDGFSCRARGRRCSERARRMGRRRGRRFLSRRARARWRFSRRHRAARRRSAKRTRLPLRSGSARDLLRPCDGARSRRRARHVDDPRGDRRHRGVVRARWRRGRRDDHREPIRLPSRFAGARDRDGARRRRLRRHPDRSRAREDTTREACVSASAARGGITERVPHRLRLRTNVEIGLSRFGARPDEGKAPRHAPRRRRHRRREGRCTTRAHSSRRKGRARCARSRSGARRRPPVHDHDRTPWRGDARRDSRCRWPPRRRGRDVAGRAELGPSTRGSATRRQEQGGCPRPDLHARRLRSAALVEPHPADGSVGLSCRRFRRPRRPDRREWSPSHHDVARSGWLGDRAEGGRIPARTRRGSRRLGWRAHPLRGRQDGRHRSGRSGARPGSPSPNIRTPLASRVASRWGRRSASGRGSSTRARVFSFRTASSVRSRCRRISWAEGRTKCSRGCARKRTSTPRSRWMRRSRSPCVLCQDDGAHPSGGISVGLEAGKEIFGAITARISPFAAAYGNVSAQASVGVRTNP